MSEHGAGLNRFTTALRDLCATEILEEKWLVAPSRRVGRQWLDTVTRAGQPVLNLRLTTLPHLALELAAPELERRGLRLLRGARAEVLVGRLWAALRAGQGGYLARHRRPWTAPAGFAPLSQSHDPCRGGTDGAGNYQPALSGRRSPGSPLGADVSLVKIKGSDIQQQLTELLVQVQGPGAAPFRALRAGRRFEDFD